MYMKHFKPLLLLVFLLISQFSIAQFLNTNKGVFTGSLESSTQRYFSDNQILVNLPLDAFASNNYMSLNYNYGKFSVGVQYEAYMPPLLGYSPQYKGSGIAHKYVSYAGDFLSFTVGNFYEQFGSGLIFRSFENRQLGINNSLNGVNIQLNPSDFLRIKMIYGKQKKYFTESNGIIRGADAELDLSSMLHFENNIGLRLGASLINKYEVYTGADPDFPATVNAYGGRLDFNLPKFSFSTEYVYKDSDPHDLNYQWFKTGNALLADFTYTEKGLGMNLSLRRLENMDTRSERTAIDNEAMVNYLPANTKQHKYALANIYPYSSQVIGEIGGQYTLFYTIKKGSVLGGKYGTKLNLNYSLYKSLDATDLQGNEGFESAFFAFGNELYYQDLNIEVNKKWSKKLKTNIGYINQHYNQGQVEGGSHPIVHSNIVFVDALIKLKKNRSARLELQHLSTAQDMKNWAAALVELNLAPSWTFYASDMYNYGNDTDKIHYYALGGSFVKNTHRIELAYVRQRESLLCVGGVCRQVPAFKGFTLNITSSF